MEFGGLFHFVDAGRPGVFRVGAGHHFQGGVHATLEVMTGADPEDPWAPGINEVEEAAEFHRDAFRDD